MPTALLPTWGSNSDAISAAAQKEALIVDDDVARGNCFRSSIAARGQGFETAPAHDGRAAMASIARESKAICRDQYRSALPGADSLGLFLAARDANPSVYVGVDRCRLAEPGGGGEGAFGEREAETPRAEDRRPGTEG